VEQIARILGSTIEDLARIVHELVLKGGHKAEVVRLRGKWVEIDPATWKKRSDFKIAVGFASGNKDAMIGRLQMIRQGQMEAIQLGLPHVKPENIYETDLELVKAADFATPERFYTDPATAEPQGPPPPDPALIKLQADSHAKEAELSLQQETAGQEAQLKMAELQLKDKEAEAKLEMERYRIDKDAETKILIATMQAQSASMLEDQRSQSKAQERASQTAKEEKAKEPDKQTKAMTETLTKAVEALTETVGKTNSSKVIVRDKNGRIERIDNA
jgi:hypothetical protein